jgi:hypothetical protein
MARCSSNECAGHRCSRPLVAAILESVDPEQMAGTLLQKTQTGNQEAAAALLKVLKNIPASLLQVPDRMASCCVMLLCLLSHQSTLR